MGSIRDPLAPSAVSAFRAMPCCSACHYTMVHTAYCHISAYCVCHISAYGVQTPILAIAFSEAHPPSHAGLKSVSSISGVGLARLEASLHQYPDRQHVKGMFEVLEGWIEPEAGGGSVQV